MKGVLQRRLFGASCQYSLHRSASTVAAKAVTNEDVLPYSKIPKIPTFPIVGSAWIYLPLIGKYNFNKLHIANMKKYYEYGPIHVEVFNKELTVVSLFDPDEIAKLYRNEGRFPNRRPIQCFKKYREEKKDIYNNGGLLTTLGQEWWEVRSATQPHMMKPKAIHAYLGAMDEVAKDFTDRMAYLKGKDGGEVPNYLEELYKWSLESVALVAFDARLGCLEAKPNREVEKIINAVNTIFEQMWKLEFTILNLWKKYPTFAYRKFEKNMDFFSAKALKFLEEAKKRIESASEEHELTFLELMISTAKDPRNITAMITDMVFAGIDTTSCTVGFTLYHLARNPEVQEKLYQEIKANVKDGPLTVETMNSLPYMKACVKESMRLNPVAIANGRTISEDMVLAGYEIPKGTMVMTQQYVIGRLEKYYPEPLKFRPERFLRDEAKHHPFAYIPFGFGTRMCIGQRIAQQEIWSLLTRIIQRYRVEYHYEDIDMVVRAVAIPDKPLRFQFFDR